MIIKTSVYSLFPLSLNMLYNWDYTSPTNIHIQATHRKWHAYIPPHNCQTTLNRKETETHSIQLYTDLLLAYWLHSVSKLQWFLIGPKEFWFGCCYWKQTKYHQRDDRIHQISWRGRWGIYYALSQKEEIDKRYQLLWLISLEVHVESG